METLICERGSNTLPGLSDIDALFLELHNGNTQQQRSILTKLESKLTQIFGTPFIIEIHTYGEFSDNFAVLPILKPKKKMKDNILTDTSITLNKFDVIYLFIGQEVLVASQPSELTAILLHEIGHLIEHVSMVQKVLISNLTKFNYISDVLSRIPIINILFLPLFIITTRTLSFKNHAYEYHADRFAVRYGYGDELANWCNKHLKSNKKQSTPKSSVILNITRRIDSIFDAATHPSFKKRIWELVKEMKTTYPKQYNSKQIKSILDKYYKL